MNRIRIVLKEQGRTQLWLSKMLDKSYPIVTNYCSNKTQPGLPTLKKIANILHVELTELLGEGDGSLPKEKTRK